VSNRSSNESEKKKKKKWGIFSIRVKKGQSKGGATNPKKKREHCKTKGETRGGFLQRRKKNVSSLAIPGECLGEKRKSDYSEKVSSSVWDGGRGESRRNARGGGAHGGKGLGRFKGRSFLYEKRKELVLEGGRPRNTEEKGEKKEQGGKRGPKFLWNLASLSRRRKKPRKERGEGKKGAFHWPGEWLS